MNECPKTVAVNRINNALGSLQSALKGIERDNQGNANDLILTLDIRIPFPSGVNLSSYPHVMIIPTLEKDGYCFMPSNLIYGKPIVIDLTSEE